MTRAQQPWDVLIAGAGPAGSSLAAALLAARPATRVCLLDRQTFPRDKACGDGIGPGVVRVLQDLDLLSACDGYEPVELLRLRSPSGRELVSELPVIDGGRPVGFVIPRRVFDHRLAQAAIARGAADHTGWGVIGAAFNSATDLWDVRVRTEMDGKRSEEILSARILVGADGARSTVRRLLGIPYNAPRHTGISVRQYAAIEDTGPRALEFDFLPDLHPAYGWCFGASRDSVNLGVVCDVAVYQDRKLDFDRLLAAHCRTLERHHRLSHDAATRKSFILPYGSSLPRLTRGRAALAGDAASMINPATGEGLYYGIYAGALLGSLLADALSGQSSLDLALQRYETRFRRKFRRHYRTNYLLKRLVASGFCARMAFTAAKADGRVLTEAVRLFMGDGDRLGVLNALRILARAI